MVRVEPVDLVEGRNPHLSTVRPGEVQMLSIGFPCLFVAQVAGTLSPPLLLTTASKMPTSVRAVVTVPSRMSSLASMPKTTLLPSSRSSPKNLHKSRMNRACTSGT